MPEMFRSKTLTFGRRDGAGFAYNRDYAHIYMSPESNTKGKLYILKVPHDKIMELVADLTRAHEHGLQDREKNARISRITDELEKTGDMPVTDQQGKNEL